MLTRQQIYSASYKTVLLCLTAIIYSCGHKKNNPPTQLKAENPTRDNYFEFASLSHRAKWNTGNVHDPSCIKSNDTYYLYSSDAYYIPPNFTFQDDTIKPGFIPVRSSKDLINWKFEGWAFNSIPTKAVSHVKTQTNGKGADGIWAPFIKKSGNEFRLYYSVSAFGANTSYIGMATSKSPLGPWTDKGEVVSSKTSDAMNAIDPSITVDPKTGKEWFYYGSYFEGLYCVELNPQTGFPVNKGDKGKCIARRADARNNIIEAPEIIYNEDLDKYFLFVAYDPLFTHYNIRVGRSDSPEGPFLDYFGNDFSEPTNNYPVLTHSYQFENHPGWSGNGHPGIIMDNNQHYLQHQGRIAPDNLMIILHTRKLLWLPSGWPTVSPERFANIPQSTINKEDIVGNWEVIEMSEIPNHVELWQGQIPPGGWNYSSEEFNTSIQLKFNDNETITDSLYTNWSSKKDILTIKNNDDTTFEAIIIKGWDWENKRETILFTGINSKGLAVWGKKIF